MMYIRCRKRRFPVKATPTFGGQHRLSSDFLFTQDLDFSDVRQFAPGTHAGIMLVRLRNPGRIALLQTVTQAFIDENVATWSGCVVVLTERKLRVHRP